MEVSGGDERKADNARHSDRSAQPNGGGKDHNFDNQVDTTQGPAWKRFWVYVGPGFLVATAYLDPGNLQTDLQAGAGYKYELLWVILLGMIYALIIQVLAANLGVKTGKHLAELCRCEYPKFLRICLWLTAEVAVIAADIPEVIGTAFALNILFSIPVWVGVLLTGLSTLLFLGVQRFGVRKLEILISLLIATMAACFFGELGFVKAPASEVLRGLFVPTLKGSGAVGTSISLFGAIVSPHNLFLHSALVLSRKTPSSAKGIKDACNFFFVECAFTMLMALIINVTIVVVAGTVCAADNLSPKDSSRCNHISLNSASFLLKAVLGKSSSTVYGIALLASGQSSAITGTYAGQFIMQGFLEIKMKKWLRNIITRTIAIAPSLIVAIVAGPSGASRLIVIASMILSFELPFTLVPMIKFSYSPKKLGSYTSSIYTTVVAWILCLCAVGINIYFLTRTFTRWLLHSNLARYGKVLVGIIVFSLLAGYAVSIVYLIFRKDTATITTVPNTAQVDMENGRTCGANGADLAGMQEECRTHRQI